MAHYLSSRPRAFVFLRLLPALLAFWLSSVPLAEWRSHRATQRTEQNQLIKQCERPEEFDHSEEHKAHLIKLNAQEFLMRKATRGHPLSAVQQHINRTISRMRVRVDAENAGVHQFQGMSALALEIDQTSRQLDAATASRLERLVRDALALVKARSVEGTPVARADIQFPLVQGARPIRSEDVARLEDEA